MALHQLISTIITRRVEKRLAMPQKQKSKLRRPVILKLTKCARFLKIR